LAGLGTARLELSAQWSAHPLYSDEQIVLGSVATVRGFTNNPARADKGLVLRSEFAPAVPVDRILGGRKGEWLFLAEALAALQPYVFGDYGLGHDIANREDVQRAGIGAGMRYSRGRVTLDASIAEPVFRCGGERLTNWQKPEAYVTLSVKIL
jgi:hemolysin activation/secretion protein